MDGNAELLDMTKVLSHLSLNQNQFLAMCITAGCDYVPNIKTVGIHKANQIVAGADFLGTLEKHRHAPPSYREDFLQAMAVFQHQIVYDIRARRVKPLNPWREGREQIRFGQACGQYP